MKQFEVTIQYRRPSGSETEVVYDVEAVSMRAAKNECRKALAEDYRRKVEMIIKISAFDQTPNVPEPVRVADNRPTNLQQLARAGDTVTVAIPITGILQHMPEGKVEIVGNGGQWRRRLTRERFEQVSGMKLEPAPPRTVVKYHVTYPDGTTYVQDYPTKSSSFGLDNLVQVRITRDADTGGLISREFVG